MIPVIQTTWKVRHSDTHLAQEGEKKKLKRYSDLPKVPKANAEQPSEMTSICGIIQIFARPNASPELPAG